MVKDTLDKYINLQRIDTAVLNVEKKLSVIPELLKGSLDRVEKALVDKNAVEEEAVSLKNNLLKVESSLESQKSMLENSQKKLTSVKNSKEYQAALKELDILKKKIDEDEKLRASLMDSILSVDKEFEEKRRYLEESEAAYDKEKVEREEENRSLFDELEALKKERTDFAATIKNSVLSKYERIRQARGNIAVVPMEQEICCGCFMKLTPQMVVNIKKELDVYQCPQCQRFIYFRKEESGAEDKKK